MAGNSKFVASTGLVVSESSLFKGNVGLSTITPLNQESITAIFVTSSGDNPRVGVGTTNPKSIFEFVETSDTSKGSELVLAGSRTAKGAIVGDSAGIINFAIPTGSANIIDSGSVGKIKGIVTNETATGVEGKIAFELFKNVNQSEDVIEFGYNIGHISTGLFNAVFTSSIELKDKSVTGYSRFLMYDSSDVLKFSVLDGNVTASNLQLENTLQFQSQPTPPTAVAGALYVDSDNNLYIAQ